MVLKNLILGGGGLRGVSYVGIIKYLDMYNLRKDITSVLGSSAGALFSILICLGYLGDELEELLLKEKFSLEILCNLEPESFLEIIDKYGLDNGDNVTRFIQILCKAKFGKKDLTLGELYQKSKIHLRILTVCLQDKCTEILDHINHPDLEIALAGKMSMCFPVYFQPVVYKDKHYVDGDLLQEYHLHLFNSSETLYFDIIDDNINSSDKINGVSQFLTKIFQCLHSKNYRENFSKYPEFVERKIEIAVTYDHFLNFELTKSEISDIIKIGFDAINTQYEIIKSKSKNKDKDTNNKTDKKPEVETPLV